jgi:hypothetical protein
MTSSTIGAPIEHRHRRRWQNAGIFQRRPRGAVMVAEAERPDSAL